MANREAIQKWVNALRSGRFIQGRGALKRDVVSPCFPRSEYYCCLGVACEVAIENGVYVEREMHDKFPTGGDQTTENWAYDGENYFLPPSVVKWLGLKSRNPFVDHVKFPNGCPLTIANDGELLSFEDIAEVIEKTFLIKD